MALSQQTVLGTIRGLVQDLTGLARCYGQGEVDENRIPPGGLECPCAIVCAGQTIEYILTSGGQRHTYYVRILLFEDGPDAGERAAAIAPFVDLIIAKFALNVALGGDANYALFDACDGFGNMQWGEVDYLGTEIRLRVSEQATATPAYGS